MIARLSGWMARHIIIGGFFVFDDSPRWELGSRCLSAGCRGGNKGMDKNKGGGRRGFPLGISRGEEGWRKKDSVFERKRTTFRAIIIPSFRDEGREKVHYFLNFRSLSTRHRPRDSWICLWTNAIALNTHIESRTHTYRWNCSTLVTPSLVHTTFIRAARDPYTPRVTLFTVESYKEHKGNWVSSRCTRNAHAS